MASSFGSGIVTWSGYPLCARSLDWLPSRVAEVGREVCVGLEACVDVCVGLDVCVGSEVCVGLAVWVGVWAGAALVAEGSADCSRGGSAVEARVGVEVGIDDSSGDSGSSWFDRSESRGESSSAGICGRVVEP